MKRIDLTGEVYGKLTVKKFSHSDGKHTHWKCRCACGRLVTATTTNLRQGHTKSCGCNISAAVSAAKVRHGHARRGQRTSLHAVWWAMLQRCNNPRSDAYANYGGRGISVCRRWHTFENFLTDMGEAPRGMSIDRIDNNAGYCKRNCRWATGVQQAANKRPRRKSK